MNYTDLLALKIIITQGVVIMGCIMALVTIPTAIKKGLL
jgi:hypothetical protein